MKIHDYFDNIYLLNLHKRKDRLDTISKKMEICDIKYDLFGATDGSVLNHIWKEFSKSNTYFKNPNYLGCAISHLSIYRDAIEKGYDKILIVEDDNCINHDANNTFSAIVNQIPEWNDLLYLGFIPLTDDCMQWDYRVFSSNFINTNVFVAKNLWGLYGYGITNSLMRETLLAYDNNFPMELDRYFVTNIQPRNRSFGIVPQIFAASDGQSDNSNVYETGMLERSVDSRFANIKHYI